MKWANNDLTQMSVGGIAPAQGSALDGYWGSDSSQHVNFIGTDGHVHELYIHPGANWANNDLTQMSGGGIAPARGSALDGYWGSDSSQHVNFTGADGHAHELYIAPSRSGGAVIVGETATFNSGYLTTDRPLGGSITIHLDNSAGDGEATINGSFHNSGFDNIDYTVSAVLVTPSFRVFTYQHSGHTEGTSAGLPFGTPNRDDNFVIPTAANPLIALNWADVLGATLTASVAATDTLVQGLEGALDSLVNSALIAAGQALGKAGAAAVIALL